MISMSFEEIQQTETPPGARHAVLYARVSSKEQEQGYSILAQQNSLRPYAANQNLVIDAEFLDVETAKKPGRPGFAAMLKYLGKNPDCRVILVEKTDRLYRNLSDAGTVEQMGVEVHFVKQGQVLCKASRAIDKYQHGMDVLDAKRYVDNLSEEVQKGMRTKAAQGLWPSYAPLGYGNVVGPDGKRIIAPDEVRGPMIANLYEWFATGLYSVQHLARKGYEEGFRFRKSSSKVPTATLHKILRNPIYMGEFNYGGVRYQGVHQPLVTREVWNRVQEILDGRRQKKHRKVTHEFAYSGLISCGHCGCSLVGEIKKGRYVYYHCTGYRGKCDEPYTRDGTLKREFARRLEELILPPAIVEWLKAELAEAEKVEVETQTQALKRQELELDRLRQRQEMLYDDRLDGRIDTATYDNRMQHIALQREQIQRRIRAAEAEMPPSGSEDVDLKRLMSQLGERFSEQSDSEQRRLLHLLVQQASWKDGALCVSLREPFECLRQPPVNDERPSIVDGISPPNVSANVAVPASEDSRGTDHVPSAEGGPAADVV